MQSPVPVQMPDQPVNFDDDDAFALSVTVASLGKLLLHAAPQLMPAGVLVTVPVPLPVR